MKLAVVVQRYGTAINGGAERHARYIAERLASHAEVEVLTTCASDYVTWRNDLPQGVEQVNRVAVRRFPVRRERDPMAFSRWSDRVFHHPHSVADELAWLDAEGPTSPDLVEHVARHGPEYTHLLFFSYRYYHAFHGIRRAASRAILVPTAERDAAVGLSIFHPVFRGVRALMYNSPEERALIQGVSANERVPSVIVGVGSDVPPNLQPNRFRQKYDVRGPFAIYVGRIDENKGCRELFEHFEAYSRSGGALSLVLVGHPLLPIPQNPRIRHVGFLNDADKFDAMAAADLLIMPSYFESLSMVALEAWALGKPVLANGRCDVLKGQCLRSHAGLYYDNADEFVGTLKALGQSRWLNEALGRNGRQFFRDFYDWRVIERKYLDMFDRLKKEPAPKGIEPLPNLWSRRRRTRPPAQDVVEGVPGGPSLVANPSSATVAPAARPVASPPKQGPPPSSDRGGGGNRRSRGGHHRRYPAQAGQGSRSPRAGRS